MANLVVLDGSGNSKYVKATGTGTDGDPIVLDHNFGGIIDADIDSIDVAKQSKGAVTTAHNAITGTATSTEIDCRGFNSVLLEITISAAQHWTFELTGCMTSGGTFLSCYELANTGAFAQMITPEIDTSRIVVFHGIPDFVKVVATEVDESATVTVKAQPFNA